MMKAQRTLMPGDPGTKNVLSKYGDKLICVRYRLDHHTSRRYKTVELIEHEIFSVKKSVRIPLNKKMKIQIFPQELQLRKIVKAAGGRWDPKSQTWILPFGEIKNLGLEKRIVAKQ